MTPAELERMARAAGLAVTVSAPMRMPQHKPRTEIRTSTPIRWAIEFSVPCRVVSEQRRSKWTSQYRRQKQQRQAVYETLQALRLLAVPPPPYLVTLTKVGPKMDSDNLAISFKAIRDGIAADLLALDDGDERIEWRYEQRHGPHGVEVRVESRET